MKARTKGSILVASAIVALIGSGAAVSGDGGDEQWRKALEARSEALNEQYGLGAHAPVTARSVATSEPSWMRALRLRSEALNKQYKLGEYEPGRKPSLRRAMGPPVAGGPARFLDTPSYCVSPRFQDAGQGT